MLLSLSLLCLAPSPAAAGGLSQVSGTLSPGLGLPDLTGRQRSLDEFAGQLVLVTFWASWCRPCIEEMPTIRRLSEAMADQPFVVVGVNVGKGPRRVQAAAGRLGITFPVLLDRDSATFEAWGADALPTAYVLDAIGRVRYIARGPLQWDRGDIIEELKHLAAEQTVRSE
jgi:thiol-disulfide isomerase/thioredoxin